MSWLFKGFLLTARVNLPELHRVPKFRHAVTRMCLRMNRMDIASVSLILVSLTINCRYIRSPLFLTGQSQIPTRAPHRRRVANHGAASDKRVIHQEKSSRWKKTSRREFPQTWRRRREENFPARFHVQHGKNRPRIESSVSGRTLVDVSGYCCGLRIVATEFSLFDIGIRKRERTSGVERSQRFGRSVE